MQINFGTESENIYEMNNDRYFIVKDDYNFGLTLVLKAPWSDDFIDVIKKENISVLRLSHSMGWKETDISFLEKLNNIGLRGVQIYSWDVKDLMPLQYIPELELIGTNCLFTKAPDFSSFKNLTHLLLDWRPKAKTIFNCSNLEYLNIGNYPEEDLNSLRNMSRLNRLFISSRKISSLAGIENLKSLEQLDLFLCPQLQDIHDIEHCQNLTEIDIECCKKLHDVSSLGKLRNLKNVKLTDCRNINSLKEFTKCPLLEKLMFVGDTVIDDGDLTPLLNLPDLNKIWFANRRHYSHTREQIAEIFASKR